MARKEREKVAVEPKSGGRLKWVLLVFVLLILVAAASGGSVYYFFVINGLVHKTLNEVEAKPIQYHSLEAFMANITSANSPVRFLRVNIALATHDPAVLAAIDQHLPAIRNDVLAHLAEQSFTKLNTPMGKEQLREELQEIIAGVLIRTGQTNTIDHVLFTDLVMQ
jgi:flagellar FliL protein